MHQFFVWLDSPTGVWVFLAILGLPTLAVLGFSLAAWYRGLQESRERQFHYAQRCARLSVEYYGLESERAKRDVSAAIDAWKVWQGREGMRTQDSWFCTPPDEELFQLEQNLVPVNTVPC